MLTAPQIVAAACPLPPPPGCVRCDALCYTCGGACTSGQATGKAIGPNFTSQAEARAPWSEWVCAGCLAVMAGKPSKDNPPQRMFSHAWSERDGWHRFNKSETAPAWRYLLDPPDCRWFLALADSGQIHLLPFTPVNEGTGAWQIRMERETVAAEPLHFARVAYRAAALYVAGYTREHILTGQPDVNALHRAGVDVWREHDQHLRAVRGGPVLRLAASLLRKEGTDEWRDECAAVLDGRRPARAGRAADDSRAQVRGLGQSEPADVLGAHAGGVQGAGDDGDHLRPDGGGSAPGVANPAVLRGSEQLNLFDW